MKISTGQHLEDIVDEFASQQDYRAYIVHYSSNTGIAVVNSAPGQRTGISIPVSATLSAIPLLLQPGTQVHVRRIGTYHPLITEIVNTLIKPTAKLLIESLPAIFRKPIMLTGTAVSGGEQHKNVTSSATIGFFPVARITSPTLGTVITNATPTFRWSLAGSDQTYRITIGSSLGAADIFSANRGTNLFARVALSAVSPIFVRLYTFTGLYVNHIDYIYGSTVGGASGAVSSGIIQPSLQRTILTTKIINVIEAAKVTEADLKTLAFGKNSIVVPVYKVTFINWAFGEEVNLTMYGPDGTPLTFFTGVEFTNSTSSIKSIMSFEEVGAIATFGVLLGSSKTPDGAQITLHALGTISGLVVDNFLYVANPSGGLPPQ